MRIFPDLNLSVKAYVQPLGSENSWTELGDGEFELADQTIRIVKPLDDVQPTEQCNILLEDAISNDTPFVGRDGCIVWNSIPQTVSLCAMFTSELGFAAAWSALQAVQQNPNIPIEFDFFRVGANQNHDASSTFRSVLNSEAISTMSFIERHCISSSIIEFDLCSTADLLCDAEMCKCLLKLCSIDLLEYLTTEDIFPKLCKCLGYTGKSTAQWTVPEAISALSNTQLQQSVTTALRLHQLKHEVLPMTTDEDVIGMIDGLNHRLHNEIVCCLLADEKTLETVALAIRNASNTREKGSQCRDDASVVAYLRFLSNLFSLVNGAFARELIPHVFSRVAKAGVFMAIAELCDNYELQSWDPSVAAGSRTKGSTNVVAETKEQSPSNHITIEKSRSPSSSSSAASVGPVSTNSDRCSFAVVTALSHFLEETVGRLNEKGEESVLGEIFRNEIIANPEKNWSFLWFLLRDMSSTSSANRLLLFHLLGLHDDEGISVDRSADPDTVTSRNDFHSFFIKKMLPEVCLGGNLVVSKFKKFPASASDHSPEAHHPGGSFTISPFFIRLVEYLLKIVNPENCTELIRTVFNAKSRVVKFLRDARMTSQKRYGKSVMCSNLQLIKAALSHADQKLIRLFTFEQDIFATYLQYFHETQRFPSLFHSTMLSLLQHILTLDNLRDIRQFVILKYRRWLPKKFCDVCDTDALAVLQLRLSGSTEEGAFNTVSSISRSRTPLQNAMILDASGFSGKKLKLEVDELNAPLDAKKMEAVATFPLRLRSMIVSISPPLTCEPERAAVPLQSPPPKSPKPTRTARTLEDNGVCHPAVALADAAAPGEQNHFRKPMAPMQPKTRRGSAGRRKSDPRQMKTV